MGKVIGYVCVGCALAGFIWLWLASLITYALNQFWVTRAAYREKMDEKVSDLLTENYNSH